MLFSSKRKTDPFYPFVKDVLDFLSNLYNQNVGYSGINTAKSAISTICGLVSGKPIGEEKLVCRFMKGIYNCRPSLPKYSSTWDVNKVMSLLCSWPINKELTLLQLSQKTAILLMLLSSQRCQTIHLIKVENILIQEDTMTIYITNLVKQSKPGHHIQPLKFQSFTENKLCIVKTLQDYLECTKELRGNETRLFISCVKPYKAVTKSTIARWIRQIMCISGIDVKIYGPHSCRSASSSAAAKRGIPIDQVMKWAGWKSDSTFYRFYFKPIDT